MGLLFDIIKDAMRGYQEEGGSSDTESAQDPLPGTSSEDTRLMYIESNELVIYGETGQAIIKEYLRSGVNFPSNLFNKVVPKTVNFLPPNINPFTHTGKYCTSSVNTIRYLNHMCKLTP